MNEDFTSGRGFGKTRLAFEKLYEAMKLGKICFWAFPDNYLMARRFQLFLESKLEAEKRFTNDEWYKTHGRKSVKEIVEAFAKITSLK